MEQKKSEFDKVLGAWDILVIAFGAMIGWGWVVSSGSWIQKGGVVGASIAFVIGGVMIFFIGLTYAELTAAMPQCGGRARLQLQGDGPRTGFVHLYLGDYFRICQCYVFRGVRLPNHHHVSVAGIPERLYVQRGRI